MPTAPCRRRWASIRFVRATARHAHGAFTAAGPTRSPCLEFLADVVRFMLEGRLPGPGDKAGPVRAPLPRFAAHLLGRLTGAGQPFASLAAFRVALEETRERPVEVSRTRRGVHLVILAALLAPGLCWMLGCIPLLLTEFFGKIPVLSRPPSGKPASRPAIPRRQGNYEEALRRRTGTIRSDFVDQLVPAALPGSSRRPYSTRGLGTHRQEDTRPDRRRRGTSRRNSAGGGGPSATRRSTG